MKIDTNPRAFLGIDVGKAELFCHIRSSSQPTSAKFDNISVGIKKLLTWLTIQCPPNHLAACLEQTGIYGRKIAEALFEINVTALHLINPAQIKAFGMRM